MATLLTYNLDFSVGAVYNFNTIAPAILQASYQNAKLIAKGDYDLAISYANINALQANIYPILINQPNGTSTYPNNPKAYEYYIFKLPSNIIIALQSSWIVPGSVVEVVGISLTITVNGLNSYNDSTKILNAIAMLGYTNISSNITTYVPTTSSTGTPTTSSTAVSSTSSTAASS